ncbi:SgcJ/EcaC family oxidoreductase [Actinocorallia sp. B10E7]|uniref:SgcJ/EcaC family oxidoreductase n=1 Tax=Actinocorallia sp. B10E7 TaxID=3153558 RepID=UPI00325F74B8
MSDLEAVRRLLEKLNEAWNDGDARAYAELFVEDADYVTFFGHNFAGREAIEESHRGLFEGPLRGSRLGEGEPPKIRFLTPDVAVVVQSVPAPADPSQWSTVTFTAVRTEEGWRFGSFQNTRRAPVPGAPS